MAKKIGILGGGQLGRMFLQVAYDYPFDYFILDKAGAPCQDICKGFVEGDFSNYDDVVAFGQNLDVIGIEIEHVNTEALKTLESQGKVVIPSADTLATIKDKGLQKGFYQQHNIHSPEYYLINSASEIDTDKISFPFVQKLRTGGYDGKGVQVIKTAEDLANLWDEPSVIETFTPIAKEIAVMVVRGLDGETAVYPSVEMVFEPKLNLVDYLVSPASLTKEQQQKAIDLAEKVANAFDSAGIFAVELFVDEQGDLWVNETAPRVHNSGHHTIEASYCSQFEQMLRVHAGLPLGNTQLRETGAMINLIGAEGYQGEAVIDGIEVLTKLEKTYLHWYGKTQTSAGRKMGHVSVLGSDEEIKEKITAIKESVKVISSF